jgi:hypothetical protein
MNEILYHLRTYPTLNCPLQGSELQEANALARGSALSLLEGGKALKGEDANKCPTGGK